MGKIPERVLAIDTETNGLDPRFDNSFRLLGLSYAFQGDNSAYLPVGHIGSDIALRTTLVLQELSGLVDRSTYIVFHNAKFDLLTIKRGLGLDLYDSNWFDTMLMQHMIDENLPNKSLEYLGKLYFNEGKEKDEKFTQFIKTFGWGFLPEWMVKPYAIQDAKLTLKLFLYLYPEFERQGFV